MDNTVSMMAYGTINAMRFVQDAVPPIVNGCLQCSGPGVPIVGIAVESVLAMMGTQTQVLYNPQGYAAAASGVPIRIYGQTGPETLVIVGSGQSVLPGQLLTSDASGNAVGLNLATASANTVFWIGGRAIEGGDAGNPIRVQPKFFPYSSAT